MKQAVQEKPFGTQDGRPVTLYTLTNANGVEVDTMNYGGIILSIRVPDRKGQFADIVLGHEKLEGYIPNPPYIGAIVGRYANRIANGTFQLDGKTYTLPKNDGPNTLHGGTDKTFNKVVWDGEALKGKTGVAYTYLSKDGDDGFPGNMKLESHLHADQQQRASHRLRSYDRQSHGHQSEPAQLFQSGRRRHQRHSESRAHAERRPLHPGR